MILYTTCRTHLRKNVVVVWCSQEKVIIKNLWLIYKYGATRIVNDHPENEWNVNNVKKLLKKTDETGNIAWKEVLNGLSQGAMA